MSTRTREELDLALSAFHAEFGSAWNILFDLVNELNFGPDLTNEGGRMLNSLIDVKSLIDVAMNLLPEHLPDNLFTES